jgi:hypothetical protein
MPIQPDFGNLQAVWKTAVPSGVKAASYTPNLQPPPCPAMTPGVWEVDPTIPIPAINKAFGAAGSNSSSGGGSGSGSNAGGKKSGASLKLDLGLALQILLVALPISFLGLV